jgi:hypothetical protein
VKGRALVNALYKELYKLAAANKNKICKIAK